MAVNLRAMRVSRVCKFKLIGGKVYYLFLTCFLIYTLYKFKYDSETLRAMRVSRVCKFKLRPT